MEEQAFKTLAVTAHFIKSAPLKFLVILLCEQLFAVVLKVIKTYLIWRV